MPFVELPSWRSNAPMLVRVADIQAIDTEEGGQYTYLTLRGGATISVYGSRDDTLAAIQAHTAKP